jgi:hypothetical protein
MKEHYDFSNGRKNPYAEKLKKEGYTVTVHYNPQDIAHINVKNEGTQTSDELETFDKYLAANE